MTRPDYVACVLLGLHEGGTPVLRTWCDRVPGSLEFHFVDATHAVLNARHNGRLLVCPACADAIRLTLERGAYREGSDPTIVTDNIRRIRDLLTHLTPGSFWASAATGRVWRVRPEFWASAAKGVQPGPLCGVVYLDTWMGDYWATAGCMRDEELVRYAEPCDDPEQPRNA